MFLKFLFFVFISLKGSFLSNLSNDTLSNIGNSVFSYIKNNKEGLAFLCASSTVAWCLKHNKSTNNCLLKIKEKNKDKSDSWFSFVQKYRAPFYSLLFLAPFALKIKSLYGHPYTKLLMLAGLSISVKDYLSELIFWNGYFFEFKNRNSITGGRYAAFTSERRNPVRIYTINDIKQTVEELLFIFGKVIFLLEFCFYIWKLHEFIQLMKIHPKTTMTIYVFLLIEKIIYFAKNNISVNDFRKVVLKEILDLGSLDESNKDYFQKDCEGKIVINYDDLSKDTQKQYINNNIVTGNAKQELMMFFYNRITLCLINYCSNKKLDDGIKNKELENALNYFYVLMSMHCLCLGDNSKLLGHGHSMCCHGNFDLIYNNFPEDMNTNFDTFLSLTEDKVFYDDEKKIINYDSVGRKKVIDLYIEKKEEKLELINKDNNFFKILENINLYLEQNI
jgi:hypothetical protein